MDTLEPETLLDREEVTVETETRTVTQPEFEIARDLESHATIGVVTEAGDVLFVADGARGWTLPAVPVERDAEWAGTAARAIESLTGTGVGVADPVRVRQVEFQLEGSDRQQTTHDVLVRSEPVAGRSVADEPTLAGEPVADVIWLEDGPDDGSDGLERDLAALLE